MSFLRASAFIGGYFRLCRFAADAHEPILIYPNPSNPKKYVVLNSGFTFRELDYLNNARQIPKLPDYAVVDTTPPDPRATRAGSCWRASSTRIGAFSP